MNAARISVIVAGAGTPVGALLGSLSRWAGTWVAVQHGDSVPPVSAR